MISDREFTDLSHEELLEIVQSDHITSEQLNLFASKAKHLTANKREEIKKLTILMERIEAKIQKINDNQPE